MPHAEQCPRRSTLSPAPMIRIQAVTVSTSAAARRFRSPPSLAFWCVLYNSRQKTAEITAADAAFGTGAKAHVSDAANAANDALAPPQPHSVRLHRLDRGGAAGSVRRALALHFVVWTTLPALLYANLPLDLIEALTYRRMSSSATTSCRRCRGGWSRSCTRHSAPTPPLRAGASGGHYRFRRGVGDGAAAGRGDRHAHCRAHHRRHALPSSTRR